MRTLLAAFVLVLSIPAAASATEPAGRYRLETDSEGSVRSFPYRLEIAWADGRTLEAVPIAADADGVLLAWTNNEGAQGWLVVPSAPESAKSLTLSVTDDAGSREIVLAPSSYASGRGTADLP
jgi:hypothetical protein